MIHFCWAVLYGNMDFKIGICLLLLFKMCRCYTPELQALRAIQLEDHAETKILKGRPHYLHQLQENLRNRIPGIKPDNALVRLEAEVDVAENENITARLCKDYVDEHLSNIVRENVADLEANMTGFVTTIISIVTNISSEVLSLQEQIKESNSRKEICENKGSYLDERIDQLSEKVEAVLNYVNLESSKVKSCQDLMLSGRNKSGVYEIYPNGQGTPIRVYCDQETDGGGWIVFQRRQDGTVNFYREWIDYKFGFGNVEGEFWLGNEKIHEITNSGNHELRIDMKDFDEEKRYAQYAKFYVGPESEDYFLYVDGYTGNAVDSLSTLNKQSFSTKDRDNDVTWNGSCANWYKGAWWYKKCHTSNLNGQYLKGDHESFADGINWFGWRGFHYSLKFVEMKVR